jgi:hypothetical protein
MPSPFLGMDPYLEGYMWADVHQALAYQFRKQLVQLVRPAYAVRLEVSMLNDRVPPHELGIMYPDVEIVRTQPRPDRTVRESPAALAIAPAPLSIAITIPVQVRLVSVEIRDVANNKLVTSIEILSPSNKREPGLSVYLAKRDELRLANVHLLEIDLLRRGTRLWPVEALPETAYIAALIRAGHIRADVWPIGLRDQLPTLPVPLQHPDPDVPLDLRAALETVYDEADYSLTLNYDEPPPEPPLAEEDAAWVREQVQRWQEGRNNGGED